MQDNVIAIHSGLKKCSKCKHFKKRHEFGKSKQTKDNLRHQCKVCYSAYQKDYRANNRERDRGYRKTYYSKNREKLIQTAGEWQRNNKETVNAQRRETRKRKKLAQLQSSL